MNTNKDTLNKNYKNYKCDKCNQRIHPNFIGYHKCGYANCPYCKNAISSSEYWDHIRSHAGHENDSPPPSRTTFGNREQYRNSSRYDVGSYSSIRSYNRNSADAIQLKVGEEYKADITKIGRRGDGVARIQDCMIFVKGGRVGEQVKIVITEIKSRFAIARTA
jgi:predicted RNA-binding protein with TRAM domain